MTNRAYKDGYSQIDWSKHKPWVPKPAAMPTGRSDLPCPLVVSDTMDPTQHVDGKHYTSKAAFRATTKREGYIEVGNDPARLRGVTKQKSTKKERHEAVSKAVEQTLGA